MSKRRANTQMFALSAPPPGELVIAGAAYRLVRVFKHDFYAATCLYEMKDGRRPVEIGDCPYFVVVKLYRTQGFCGLPMAWLGRLSRDHEQAIYAALAGVANIPRWVGAVGEAGLAIEYIQAVPLDHAAPPPGYFDRLRAIFDAVHARGVAYVDANKRSNMLVTPAGEPFLIDFQIALRRRDDWPWPIRTILARAVAYLQAKDLYHLYKHKRRLAPAELTSVEEELSRNRSFWHLLHRKLAKPYRAVRRRFLARQYQSGQLTSPTADLETHRQPEKDSWRKED